MFIFETKMKTVDVIFFLLSHFMASCVHFAFLIITFAGLIVLEYVFDPDPPGGPGFMPAMMVFSIPYAVFFCVFAFWITVALQILRFWKKYPRWLPPVVDLPIALVFLIPIPYFCYIGAEALVMSLFMALFISVDFCIYWLLQWGSDTFINLIRKSIQKSLT